VNNGETLNCHDKEIKRPFFCILPKIKCLDDKWTIRLIFPAAAKHIKEDDCALSMEEDCETFKEAEEQIVKMMERFKQYGVYYLKVNEKEITY
jgi:hypothetical protein